MNDSALYGWVVRKLPRLQAVHERLENETSEFSFHIRGVRPGQLTLNVEVEKSEFEKQFSVSKKTHFEKKFVNQSHITFGYQYNAFENDTISEQISEQLLRIIKDEFPSYLSSSLRANKPKLCYFNNMTKFVHN